MTVDTRDSENRSSLLAGLLMNAPFKHLKTELDCLANVAKVSANADAAWISIYEDGSFEALAADGLPLEAVSTGQAEAEALYELRVSRRPARNAIPPRSSTEAPLLMSTVSCPFISEGGAKGAITLCFGVEPSSALVGDDLLLALSGSVRAAFEAYESQLASLAEYSDLQSHTEHLGRRLSELQESHASLQLSKGRLESQNVELKDLAELDSTTGLLNQRIFYQELERRIEAGQDTAVGVIDIDNFKLFNDTWGHAAGDELLRQVGRILQAECGIDSLAARYGGEEFAIIFGPRSAPRAMEIAEDIRRKIDESHWDAGHVTVSIGIASRGAGSVGGKELFDRADRAMYASKRSGKNRVLTWN